MNFDYPSSEDDSTTTKASKNKLPSPNLVLSKTKPTKVTKKTETIGIVKQVDHLIGDWPTFVYIDLSELLDQDFIARVVDTSIESHPFLQKITQWHISLSRTVHLKVFQISSFVKSMAKKLNGFQRFHVGLNGYTRYINDDKSKSFLGLNVYSPTKQVFIQ